MKKRRERREGGGGRSKEERNLGAFFLHLGPCFLANKHGGVIGVISKHAHVARLAPGVILAERARRLGLRLEQVRTAAPSARQVSEPDDFPLPAVSGSPTPLSESAATLVGVRHRPL